MSFQRAVPNNVGELKANFATLFENKNHVKRVEVNLTTGHLEVTLDWLAHTKANDFYLPLKRSKINDAKALVEKMLSGMDTGFPPADAQIQELWDDIDPSAK